MSNTTVVKKLLFWYHRKRYGVPSVVEIMDICQKYPYLIRIFKHSLNNRRRIAVYYTVGFTIDEIAKNLNISRERVRQVLYRLYRMSKNPETLNDMKQYEKYLECRKIPRD